MRIHTSIELSKEEKEIPDEIVFAEVKQLILDQLIDHIETVIFEKPDGTRICVANINIFTDKEIFDLEK